MYPFALHHCSRGSRISDTSWRYPWIRLNLVGLSQWQEKGEEAGACVPRLAQRKNPSSDMTHLVTLVKFLHLCGFFPHYCITDCPPKCCGLEQWTGIFPHRFRGSGIEDRLGWIVLVHIFPKVVIFWLGLQEGLTGTGVHFQCTPLLSHMASNRCWLWREASGFFLFVWFFVLGFFFPTSLSKEVFKYTLRTRWLVFPRMSNSKDSGRSSHLF